MNIYLAHDGSSSIRALLRRLNIPNGTDGIAPPGCGWLIRWRRDEVGAGEGRGGEVCEGGGRDVDSEGGGCGAAPIVLNRSAAVRKLSDRRFMERRLRDYGIAYAGRAPQSVGSVPSAGGFAPPFGNGRPGRFVVPVFQAEALAVLRPPMDWEFGEKSAIRAAGVSRVANRAGAGMNAADESGAEAVAGRDAGTAPNRYAECRDAGGELRPQLATKLGRYAVRAVYACGLDFACVELRLVGRNRASVLGIDPFPLAEGRMAELFAAAIERFSDRTKEEAAGKPDIMLGMDPEFILMSERGKVVPASRFLNRNGLAGYDSRTAGSRRDVHPLAELRPDPSGDPIALIRNLRRTMWEASKQITDRSLRWLAGGMPVPGLPLGGHVHLSGIYPASALIRALDNFLALPLAMIEDETTVRRRKRYGRLGDVRPQSHGGFEYRTLPSWIASPPIAKGVVALAKIVAAHYRELRERPLDDPAILEAFIAGDKAALRETVRLQWRKLEELDGYRKYAFFLDPLKDRIMTCRGWDEHRDFRKYWRIPPFNEK